MVAPYIHESAEVNERASLAENVKVWNLVQVREGACIGKNTILSKNVYIDFDVKIGSNVKIQNNVSVYHGVTIEDDVFIGPAAVFTNDFRPRATNVDWQITPTLIKRGASVGANATIICGIEIGEFALIGSGAVVNKNAPAHGLMVGNPAKCIGFVYKNGERVDMTHLDSVCHVSRKAFFIEPQSSEKLGITLDKIKMIPA